ncbi:hypothetical protein [Pyruvatibacter sp.]|uniref:hypothetical protein n=1 Tax=Pyruvatibacter sp. TaxID=1981328 RepID=UPI003265FC83
MSKSRDIAGIIISLVGFGFLAYVAYVSGDADFTDRSRGFLNFVEMITNAVVSRLGRTNGALVFAGTGLLSASYYFIRMKRRN